MAEAPADTRQRTRLRDLGLTVLAGTLTFLAFPTAAAPEYSFFWLIWFSHVPLLWVLRDKTPKQAFRWGLLCGIVVNTGGYYWLAMMLQTFGQLPIPVAIGGMMLHSIWVGLMWALWAWLINRVANTTSLGIEWSAPLAMVAVEAIFPRIFPAYMGNSQYPFSLVMQVCDLFGITAVTFLVYRVNANLFLWVRAIKEGRPRPRKATIVTGLMLGFALIYGAVRMHQYDGRMDEATKLKIGLVEADVGIFLTETAEKRRDHLLINQQLSAQAEAQGAELLVWSESSYRKSFLPRRGAKFPRSDVPLVADATQEDRNTSRYDRIAPIRGFNTPLLFGSTSTEPSSPRWQGDVNYTPRNTAWLLDKDGVVQGAYDKVFLLVFGEYVPFAKHIPWIYDVIKAAGNLEPGRDLNLITADLWNKGPIKFGILICYEGILPAFTRGIGNQRPHVLVNITNDDWFGNTPERYLHLALAIPRAIEHRVPFVRGTLTGVSAFVDANGRLLAQTKPTEPEILVRDVPLMQSATVYQVIGDAFPWTCVFFIFGFYGWGRWRRR